MVAGAVRQEVAAQELAHQLPAPTRAAEAATQRCQALRELVQAHRLEPGCQLELELARQMGLGLAPLEALGRLRFLVEVRAVSLSARSAQALALALCREQLVNSECLESVAAQA